MGVLARTVLERVHPPPRVQKSLLLQMHWVGYPSLQGGEHKEDCRTDSRAGADEGVLTRKTDKSCFVTDRRKNHSEHGKHGNQAEELTQPRVFLFTSLPDGVGIPAPQVRQQLKNEVKSD